MHKEWKLESIQESERAGDAERPAVLLLRNKLADSVQQCQRIWRIQWTAETS